jgi:hypothetical protein
LVKERYRFKRIPFFAFAACELKRSDQEKRKIEVKNWHIDVICSSFYSLFNSIFFEEIHMPTHQKLFDSVNDILREGNKVFVIPVFQRPYAWEDQHIQTLIDDIDTASQRKPKPFHYLSPIHVIEVEDSEQKEWKDYVDNANDDIIALNDSGFQTDTGSALKVYLVIDGQQRLTTLFSLLWGINTDRLTFDCGQKTIPRIILSPPDDHFSFRSSLGLPSKVPSISSRAQERLKICFSKSIDAKYKPFIDKGGLKLLLVELDAHYGLQAFQTQNDRGKLLTTLEKLKSLMMEYDLNINCGYVSKIHSGFGYAYYILDKSDCLVTEDDFIQLLSIIMRITSDTDCLWQSADNAYDVYFSKELKNPSQNSSTCQILDDWINTGDSIIQQIDHLDNMRTCKSNQVSCIMPHLNKREIEDDYRIVLQSLGLNIRNYAVLFKIRQKYPNIEWHEKKAKVPTNNQSVIGIINSKLNNIKADAGNNIPNFIETKISEINKMIHDLEEDDEEKGISALEVVERMQLFILDMGSSYPGGFKDYWDVAFNKSTNINETLNKWYEFATAYWTDNKARFIENLFSENLQEKIRNYVLMEYESFKFDSDIHFNKGLHIEHIFPQTPTVNPPNGYFPGQTTAFDYDKWITKIGNLVYLDASLNESIKHSLPEIKASSYVSQSHNKIVVLPEENQVQTSINIGTDFNLINDTQFFRIYLDLRIVELAIFAVKRFY